MIKSWMMGGLLAPYNFVAPAITGTVSPAYELTCSPGSWAGVPSLITITYQWQHTTTNIVGATSSTYTMTDFSYIGETLRCVVTGTNAVGATDVNTANTAAVTPVIGDYISGEGGYYIGIFDAVSDYYLFVVPKINETQGNWGPEVDEVTGVTSPATGLENTAALVALGEGYYAATYCSTLELGGKTDWYLPASNELWVTYRAAGAALTAKGQLGQDLWASTEEDETTAAVYDVSEEVMYYDDKYGISGQPFIRAFRQRAV